MKKNISKKILFLFTFLQILSMINTQTDKCSLVSDPRNYADCDIYNSIGSPNICCLVRGVYGANNGTACILVDSLFTNKSISLTIAAGTGTMTCGANVSVSNFLNLKNSVFFYILFFYLFSFIF